MTTVHPLRHQIPACELVVSAAVIGDHVLLREITQTIEIPEKTRQIAEKLARQGGWKEAVAVLKHPPVKMAS